MVNGCKVTKIVHTVKPEPYIKVGIYCRVSTIHPEQGESLEAQIQYFRAFVKSHVSWILIDTYADKATGRNVSSRTEFNRMIEDCESKRIDMILTKSVSRFGRNTVDTLEAIQKLRLLGVDVYFDLEELHSINAENDFVLTILETYAQSQSESLSGSIKWGIRHSLQSHESKLYRRRCFGYTHDADGFLIIQEREAEVVRSIYRLYLDGYSIVRIAREMERRRLLTPTGKDKWSNRTIDTILSNEKYHGEVIYGKTYVSDYFQGKRKRNEGSLEKFHLTNSHPGIITKEEFEAVQTEKQRRTNVDCLGHGKQRRATRYCSKAKGCSGVVPRVDE